MITVDPRLWSSRQSKQSGKPSGVFERLPTDGLPFISGLSGSLERAAGLQPRLPVNARKLQKPL